MKDFDKALLNLKILTQIRPNTKIRQVGDGILDVEEITPFTAFKRFKDGENRNKNINDIDNVIESIIEKCNNVTSSRLFSKKTMTNLSDSYIYSQLDNEYTKQYKLLELIYNDLYLIPQALQNLKKVYDNDKKICSKIDLLCSKVFLFIQSLQNQLQTTKGIFSVSSTSQETIV